MGKFCAEEITMGFVYPNPVSKFYGHFNIADEAVEWCRNKYPTYEEINESDLPFFQKDFGASVKEVYIQDCEDTDFLSYSNYLEDEVIAI